MRESRASEAWKRGTIEIISEEELKDFLKGKVADWWIPEKFILMSMIPKTSVGKFNKKELRKMYSEGQLK